MTTKRTTTRKKRTGRVWSRRETLLLPLFGRAPLSGKGSDPDQSGVVAGTVFADPGYALRGARVVVRATSTEGAKKPKPSEWKVATDGRGEFAVRVPAGSLRYVVAVEARGFARQEKETLVGINERVELNFLLEPLGR